MSKANKKEKAPKEKREKGYWSNGSFASDIFWTGRILVILSIAFSAYVVIAGTLGQLVYAILATPMIVYAVFMLFRGRQ